MFEAEMYFREIGIQKFSFFRLYQGGKYLFFSSDKKLTKSILFKYHQNSPIYMRVLQNLPENEPRLYVPPLETKDPMINLLYDLKWGSHCVVFCRHGNFISALRVSAGIENKLFDSFCLNNMSLLKNFYFIFKKIFDLFIPYEQPGVLSQFREGADIAYTPSDDPFHLPEVKEKTHLLLEELSRKKLSLTPREWEVCKGLVRGETAKETAGILGIGDSTVHDHLRSMYRKFGKEGDDKPTRVHVVRQIYQIIDKDFVTRTLWKPEIIV
jgi:DNA-binding CsgD family transcriptional regulator